MASSSSPTSVSTPPSINPRRVPVSSSGHGLSNNANAMFRKGATFHSPTSDSSPVSNNDGTPFFPPNLPRSQSNLDDVIDAYRRRAALTIDSVGELLAAVRISPKSDKAEKADTPDNKDGKNPVFFDDDCVPRGILDHTIVPDQKPAQPQQRRIQPARGANQRRSHDHASDSGLGSSIASSSKKGKAAPASPSAAVQAKAITRSAAASATAAEKPAGLSVRASSRIYEHTIRPLLAKPAYKPFHPVLIECASKINKKDIVCLRDLEKTILLLAPERTKAAKLYLEFSLESIRCLQTTVEYLSDREQTRPTDAPYTAGYFIDLVEQIHHYAQQLADARDNKKSINNMDINRYTSTASAAAAAAAANDKVLFPRLTNLLSSDEIKLHGGITVNGRPAELVRVSADGRAVSIATGLPVELEEDAKDAIRMKRSATQELEDEEEIMRSMARRKKNAPPEEYAPKMCSVPGCTKEFKRPCDLTKHEKTHSRPWKCVMESCKYHEYGWPTEKERDRHMNDKHSDNPAMYECLYKPCTYKSKRDSNRKQHMEKTHGWTYVRTKTNGTGKPTIVNGQMVSTPRPSIDASASSTTQPTPQLVNMPTPASAQSAAVATPPQDEFEFNTPLFGMGAMGSSAADLEFPTCAPGDILPPDNLPAEMNDMDFALDLDGSAAANNMNNDASAYASPYSASSSLDNTSAYQDIGPDMATMYDDIYAAPMQLPTLFSNGHMAAATTAQPNDQKAIFERFLSLQPDLSVMTPAQQAQMFALQMQMQLQQQHQQHQQQQNQLSPHHFSPLAETTAMLFTPDSMMDEGFVDYSDLDLSKAAAAGFDLDLASASPSDFILFPPVDMASLASSTSSSPGTTPGLSLAMTTAAPVVPAHFTKGDPLFDTLFEELTPSMAGGYSQPASQVFDMGMY
ncbi:zinc finger transcription factor ace1 [Ophiostoma piceae UAMH 11346]|uniref:Zinc finger transcription factor ace1 n=1 Tax=Ophiostoma piceae (strain UAMH 11346) TaxID=1262450 RepID=S3CMV2_OPHP1|nr:zinc finger transcription factor ace1 [Ophiostoma piceae UAMH 11346]